MAFDLRRLGAFQRVACGAAIHEVAHNRSSLIHGKNDNTDIGNFLVICLVNVDTIFDRHFQNHIRRHQVRTPGFCQEFLLSASMTKLDIRMASERITLFLGIG